MSLYTKILLSNLEDKNTRSLFPRLREESDRMVNEACQQAILEIREAVSDAVPDEKEADHFYLVQRVILALDKIGINLNWDEFK